MKEDPVCCRFNSQVTGNTVCVCVCVFTIIATTAPHYGDKFLVCENILDNNITLTHISRSEEKQISNLFIACLVGVP